jgi:hypothetical protein
VARAATGALDEFAERLQPRQALLAMSCSRRSTSSK